MHSEEEETIDTIPPHLHRVNPAGVSHSMAEIRGLTATCFAILIALMDVDRRDDYLEASLYCVAFALPLLAVCFRMVRSLDFNDFTSDRTDRIIGITKDASYIVVVMGLAALFGHFGGWAVAMFVLAIMIAVSVLRNYTRQLADTQSEVVRLPPEFRPSIPPKQP